MTIRKDSFIKGNNIIGLVVKMNKKANEIVVSDQNDQLVTVAADVELTKITKAEYLAAVEEMKAVEVENTVSANRAPNKQALAFDIFLNYHQEHVGTRRTNRAPIIQRFMSEVGLTKRGAETYYYNANKLFSDQLTAIHAE